MSDAVWYYVDRQQQRNGPVTAAAVAEAYGFGWIDDSSLVWREGLGAWVPLAGHRAELGIVGPPSAQPQPAYPPAPRSSSKKLGCLIIAVVVTVLAVPVLAILAAIALPAYQDYIIRSQMASAHMEARGVIAQAEEFQNRTGRCPTDSSELALAPRPGTEGRSTELSVGETFDGLCTIEARVVGGNPRLSGIVAIRMTRSADGQWTCTSEMDQERFLPAACSPQ